MYVSCSGAGTFVRPFCRLLRFQVVMVLNCTCAGTFSDHFGAFFAACAAIDAFDAFDTLSAGFSRTHCPCQLAGLILVRPTPFGLLRTPNPKGTFARFCATKCYSSRAYVYVGPGGIARFARFCATKCYSSRAYINIDPGGIAFARFFARFARASPAHLIGSPNPLVSRAPQTLKGLSRLRGFPLSLRNA